LGSRAHVIWHDERNASLSDHPVDVCCANGQLVLVASKGVYFSEDGFTSVVYQSVPCGLNSCDRVTMVACGMKHIICCTSEGQTFTWGSNTFGQLGTGDTRERLTPIHISTVAEDPLMKYTDLFRAIKVCAGPQHSFALCECRPSSMTTDSKRIKLSLIERQTTLFGWGRNNLGQLGLQEHPTEPGEEFRLLPEPVSTLSADQYWVDVACGFGHTVAISSQKARVAAW